MEGSKRKGPKTQRKEGGQSEEELHPLLASKQAFLCLWAFRATTGGQGALAGADYTQVLAGHTGSRVCQLEGKQAGRLWKGEGRCSLLVSEELERTEPSPVNLARPDFLPQGEFFPVLGKHTWLEFSCPGPGAQSFLPSGWSLGEIKHLADTKRFDVKNRWQETKNKR